MLLGEPAVSPVAADVLREHERAGERHELDRRGGHADHREARFASPKDDDGGHVGGEGERRRDEEDRRGQVAPLRRARAQRRARRHGRRGRDGDEHRDACPQREGLHERIIAAGDGLAVRLGFRRVEGHAIEARGLVRVFKKGPRAVDGIDLDVATGEIYGFLGPNGAGKSTTVLMLTTLLPPTEGTARVGGFDVVREGPQVRATIGAALQEAALDPLLTGREHLRLQARCRASAGTSGARGPTSC